MINGRAKPLIENCIAWVECGLQDTMTIGDHTLFIARVLVVQANEDAFDQTWTLESQDAKPLHYLGMDRYATLGSRQQAELATTDEGTIELAETKEEREKREEFEALEAERLLGVIRSVADPKDQQPLDIRSQRADQSAQFGCFRLQLGAAHGDRWRHQ